MRKAFASLTATAVASARALATGSARVLADPHDTAARRLLPAALGLAVDAIESTRLGRQVVSPLLVRASLGMVDHIALRCAAIDQLLGEALGQGVEQVVIVGAGLDGRAHRLQALRAAVVYEVDHPASQHAKRERAAGLAIAARALRYVPIDLAREPLAPGLLRAAFDPNAPCFAIVEGVLPYLAREQIGELLRQLSELSARGSALVLSYIPEDATWMRLSRWLVGPTLRAIGEPLGDLLSPDELSAMLAAHGFAVTRDATPAELVELPPHRGEPLVSYERMVLALRR